MSPSTRYIIVSGISCGMLSMVYFLSLVCHIPFLILIPLVLAGIFLLFRWSMKGFPEAADSKKIPYLYLSYLLFFAGMTLIVYTAWDVDEKYGGWDAWCFWNLHARYMAGGANLWRNLFLNQFADHTDYPLLLPGFNGFFMRLFHGRGTLYIPYVLGFWSAMAIPVLLFLEIVKKNILVAAIVFFLMARDGFFILNGISQYADLPLAFFFLCALISLNYARENGKYLALCAVSLGCCMWTKNEGAVLSVVFILFNLRLFLSKSAMKPIVAGFILPLFVFILFKIGYAPQNDLASGLTRDVFMQVFDGSRYQLIYKSFSYHISTHFVYCAICFVLYVLLCLIQRKWPERQFFMLLTCMATYLLIYLLSTQNLQWHLETSLARLMIQLMPSFMYVISQRFSGLHLQRSKQFS